MYNIKVFVPFFSPSKTYNMKKPGLLQKLLRSVGFWQIIFFLVVVALGIAMAMGWIPLRPVTPYN